jgi:hypothetical protein
MSWLTPCDYRCQQTSLKFEPLNNFSSHALLWQTESSVSSHWFFFCTVRFNFSLGSSICEIFYLLYFYKFVINITTSPFVFFCHFDLTRYSKLVKCPCVATTRKLFVHNNYTKTSNTYYRSQSYKFSGNNQ